MTATKVHIDVATRALHDDGAGIVVLVEPVWACPAVIAALDAGWAAAELAPAAGIDSLPELMEGFRAAGLTVTLTLKGTPTTEPERAEQGRELAIYRTVQEALTNTLRYAGQEARASVVVHQGPATSVTIEDDGGVPGHARTMDGIGSGHGLIGLAERLRVFGGELEYGPTRAGGWTVTAVLPASRDGEGEATHD